jgi:hypothetical protein
MMPRNPKNERLKRQYADFLKHADGKAEQTIRQVEKAIQRYEAFTGQADFGNFNQQRARSFKEELASQNLAKATILSTITALKRFFGWLAVQPGYKSKINLSDIEFLSLSDKDIRAANAPADRAIPTLEQVLRVVDNMTSVDELIAAQAQKVDALKAHKKGLMQQLFPQEGKTQPRLRFPEFRDAEEWKQNTLNGIGEITSGTTPLRSNADFFEGGSIPWVKTTDLNNSFITETEEKITPKARARLNPAGSILVAMYGGFNQIGRTGCLDVPAATNQAISVLVVDRKITLPVYVLAWLNAKVEHWKRIASSSRKDPNITGSDVGRFPIQFPKINEQQRIADCLTSLDDLIAAQTQKLDAFKTHKKGLMQQLFPSPEEVEA